MSKDYTVLAYYSFKPVKNPQLEIDLHKAFFFERDVKGRIYISEEGINGQMSGSTCDALAYERWLTTRPSWKKMIFKKQEWEGNVFARMTVKYKKHLVAFGKDVTIENAGTHVSPEKWAEMLEKRDDDTIVIDTRNKYEWKVGHFEGSVLPNIDVFRSFPEYARNLRDKRDVKKTKVMMCCTGGIRCELYSSYMKEIGFENVFQLDGGLINYGNKMGARHYRGKVFVFDDRMVIPMDENDTSSPIAECSICGTMCDTYHNCAHIDCNELFIACDGCFTSHKGCCSAECENSSRLRPLQAADVKYPYRRLSKETKTTLFKNT